MVDIKLLISPSQELGSQASTVTDGLNFPFMAEVLRMEVAEEHAQALSMGQPSHLHHSLSIQQVSGVADRHGVGRQPPGEEVWLFSSVCDHCNGRRL